MTTNTPNSIRTKLGTARKVARSRIWLQGARLAAHGFTPGRYFRKEWEQDRLTLTLMPEGVQAGEQSAAGKVSGKGDLPIIDVTGEQVRTTFAGDYVTATFAPGRIVIEGGQS